MDDVSMGRILAQCPGRARLEYVLFVERHDVALFHSFSVATISPLPNDEKLPWIV